jgi:hypothetical protein
VAAARTQDSADWQEDLLAFLVAPVDGDTFLRDYYEKMPLLNSAGDRGRFSSLLSIDRLDEFLAGADLRDGMLDLARHGDPVARGDYVDEEGRIRPAAVAREYGRGATLVLPQLHESIFGLGEFVRAVEELFSCQVTSNIYLTPPGNQGFPPHYDNHDVFVLQVSGGKLWRLYETSADTPYRGERFEQSGMEPGAVAQEFRLGPGDCAYLPRGVMHDAENIGDEPSLHITVGLFTRKWADLVLEAVSELALAEPDFRRSLPPGFAASGFDREVARAHFDNLIDLVAEKAEMDGAFDLLADSFIRARKPNVSGVLSAGPPVARPGERYRRRRFVAWNVADDEGRIVLIGPGGDLAFDGAAGPALDVALSGEPFALEDLGCGAPEEMVRTLWAHGFIERVGA